MALVLGTNSGFVIAAPTAAASGGTAVVIDGSSVVTKHTSPSTATTIVEIGWYRRTGTNTSNFEIALYGETAGVAATRLQVDATNSSSVGPGWIRTAVAWAISGGTAYWLGLQMDAHSGSSDMPREDSGGVGIDLMTSQTTLADPYGGGAVIDADGMYAIYALWAPVHAPITGVIAAAAAAGVAGTVSIVNAPVDVTVTGVIAAATAAAAVGVVSVPLTAGFEQGTNGATITTGDAGDTTVWGAVGIPAGATVIYDATQSSNGSQAAKIATGATAGNAMVRWTTTQYGTQSGTHYGRFYIYMTANPGAAFQVVRGRDSGAGQSYVINVLTDGTLQMLGVTTGTLATTNPINLNGWTRVEYKVIQGTGTSGQVELKLFLDPASATPTETQTRDGINTAASSIDVHFGITSVANIGPFWLDSIIAAAASYPGPDPSPMLRLVQGAAAAAAAAGLPGEVSIVSGSADVSVIGVIAAAAAAGVTGTVRFDANISGVGAAAAATGVAGTPAVRTSGATATATAAGIAGAARFDDNLTGVRAAATAAGVAGSVSIISGSTDATVTGVIAAASTAGAAGATRFDFNLTGVRAAATTAGAAGSFHADSNPTGVRATATAAGVPGVTTISTPLDGVRAAATAAAAAGTLRFDINLTGASATATAAGQPGIVGAATLVAGVRAAAAAAGVAGTLFQTSFLNGVRAAATGAGNVGTVRFDLNVTGVPATAAAAGQAGSVFAGSTITITGVQATATATGASGSFTLSYILDGARAAATATASGSLFITSTIIGSPAIATATGLSGSVFTGGAGFPAITTSTHAGLNGSKSRATASSGKTVVLVGASGATHAEERD